MSDLDTQTKRMSGMHLAMPWRNPAKVPSGSFTQGERQAADFMYSGIAAAGGATFKSAWARSANVLIRTIT